ncbi:hypothetical protein EHZ47_22530 [Aeromonas jandaei]|uniref:hypothetical protein n=1 Tax=Aeromonas jandaei TaxID=650 RepID=UPI000F542741|nr:hypothetical protein [Aeromonas jandaei]RQM70029.1 hypothetical protein EHZ47_22530 [Aeromonas jandaei]
MSKVYYVISEVDQRQSLDPHSSEWPKLIAYSYETKKICIYEGEGYGFGGGLLSIDQVAAGKWSEFFNDVNATWFKNSLVKGELNTIKNEDEMLVFLNENKCFFKKIIV